MYSYIISLKIYTVDLLEKYFYNYFLSKKAKIVKLCQRVASFLCHVNQFNDDWSSKHNIRQESSYKIQSSCFKLNASYSVLNNAPVICTHTTHSRVMAGNSQVMNFSQSPQWRNTRSLKCIA